MKNEIFQSRDLCLRALDTNSTCAKSVRRNERKYDKRKKVEQMPLTMATMGEVNKIVKVGGNEETRRFLENLGFVAGTEITVVSSIGGNLIVNVKDSRIAVNEDMARHIVI